MTAMGIIGIVLAGIVGIGILMGAVSEFYNEICKARTKQKETLIHYAMNCYADATRSMFKDVMTDTIEALPKMAQGIYQTLTDEEH